MEPTIWIALMFSGVLVGILAGTPIAFVLGGLAVFFGYFGMGERVFPMFVNRMWQTSVNELLAAIPMFIFMAAILDRSGIADGLFKRSEEHTSELQSRGHLVCRLLLEKKK